MFARNSAQNRAQQWLTRRGVEWVEFEVVWGENLELENGVNGGGEEEEEAELPKMPLPFSLVYFWSRLNRFCYR